MNDRDFPLSRAAACSITLLPLESFPSKEAFAGAIDSFESKQLRLSCRQPLPVFGALTVQHEDTLFLGEVITCAPKADGREWMVVVKVEQVLTALQSLLCLRKQLLEAERPTQLAPLRETAFAA